MTEKTIFYAILPDGRQIEFLPIEIGTEVLDSEMKYKVTAPFIIREFKGQEK